MRVTLMHNPGAGAEQPSKRKLIRYFEKAGHTVTYQSTDARRFARALDDPGDCVAIAGGDGTVRKVMLRLIGRNVFCAVVPLGTANNIARALGLMGEARQIIRSLSAARFSRIDVGMARGPWGDLPFLEGAGTGIFPRMMLTRIRHKQRKVQDAVDLHGSLDGGLHLLLQILHRYKGRKCRLTLDGDEVHGNFLMIEALNIPTIGPVLALAPRANPGDGFLDVAIAETQHRARLHKLLATTLTKNARPPALKVRRAQRIEWTGPASDFHYDDELWPEVTNGRVRPRITGTIKIEIRVLPGVLRVLTPETTVQT